MAGAAKDEVKGQQYGAYDNLNGGIRQEYRQNEAKSAAAAAPQLALPDKGSKGVRALNRALLHLNPLIKLLVRA